MNFLLVSDWFSEVKNALLSFNWVSDVLDILLVTFILYMCIKLIRDTKAIQLAKGFILILILFGIVKLLNMEVSSYILSMVFSNLLLVLVVIFSPEIRHVLESVGRSSVTKFTLFSLTNNEDLIKNDRAKNMINAVCRSCSEMSDKKIGALIVFERETLLGDIIETGTMLDSEISPEILGNVFFPKAPLHDGAIVIRDFRICAAGCILPLTKTNDISSSLGTRHRAALGMSEQSDALVVVVSEETGSISVAEKGNLRRDISDGDLREILTQEFVTENSDNKNLFKNIFKSKKN